MLESWTRGVLRVRLVVLAAWLAAGAAGIAIAPQLGPLLSNSLAVPGSESDRARELLEAHYGERPDGTFTVVVRTPAPRDRQVRAGLERRLARAARAVPGGRASSLRREAGCCTATS